MNIRIQQINVTVGDIRGNEALVVKALREAEGDGVELLILPELVTCGYPPMDLLERRSFQQALFDVNDRLVRATGKTALLFGSIGRNPAPQGRPVHNIAILAHEGKVVDAVRKTLLPTYDVFDEFRYFEPNRKIHVTEWAGRKWGITICEDIWNNQNEYNYHTYDIEPADELRKLGAEVLVNISASPFTRRKPEMREDMLQRHAKRLGIPVLYANQVGANTELIFDGISSVISAKGEVVLRLATLREDRGDVHWPKSGSPVPRHAVSAIAPFPGSEERIFRALVLGLRDYVEKSGMSGRVVLGLSGGIDSALTAVIAREALGPEKVLGITMPSPFSSGASVTDSEQLAANLGIRFYKVPIKNIYDTFLLALEPVLGDTSFDVTEENLQSRARGTLLMAISNKFGHMLLNTGNKSELAVGYCTLYGDMAGGLSVLSDVYKTEVFRVSRWLNDEYYGREVIPWSTIEKPPSAELRPDQKDSDSLPEYDVLDGVLRSYIEDQLPAEAIIAAGHPEKQVRDVIRMVDRNEYKRRQAAPGLRVSSKAFGSGRRLPIVQRWTELG
jgi:NAD+ synthase (glutamine-hydrolysing)